MSTVELRVLTGTQAGTLIPIPAGKFLIGREHDCQLRPNSEMISRHHCVFTLDAYSIRLRDLGSTNGTFVNGERLRGMAMLNPGDQVSIGKLDVVVVVDGRPEVASEETVHARREDTVVVGAPQQMDGRGGDSSFDFSTMAAEAAQLDDEATAVPAAAESTTATVMVTGDTREVGMVPQFGASAQPMPVGAELQAVPAGAEMPGMPPGYNPWAGVPPQQYAYPPGAYPPGAFPQYPPMPYGYGYPYPGVPQGYPPGYGYPAAPQAAPVEAAPAAKTVAMQETRLPNPSETGAKPPEPKPVPTAADSKDPNKVHIPSAAQDIINSYLTRRPKSN